jgi:hypothetical protein
MGCPLRRASGFLFTQYFINRMDCLPTAFYIIYHGNNTALEIISNALLVFAEKLDPYIHFPGPPKP